MKTPELGDILFRAESHVLWTELGPEVSISIESHTVVATTPKFMWLAERYLSRERVLELDKHGALQAELNSVFCTTRPGQRRQREAKILWAWPTRELALESLRKRTEFRIMHAQRHLDAAKQVAVAVSRCAP